MADAKLLQQALDDWNDVRFFLAVARAGSLARAANVLGVDQTTVGRRIASLEGKLAVALFTRSAAGLQVSAAGASVLEAAERMEEASLELRARAAGDHESATVRVATVESLAEAFVIPALPALRAQHPGISVILAIGWARVDLRKGEADLAVRLARPTDPRLACRKLGSFAFRLYAARSYVAAHGMPTSLDGHALIAFEESVRSDARHPFAELSMERAHLAVLSNSHRVLVTSAAAGLGIVQLPSFVGEPHPDLVRVLPDAEVPYTVWLVVPVANRRVAAVRAVSDAIAERFRSL